MGEKWAWAERRPLQGGDPRARVPWRDGRSKGIRGSQASGEEGPLRGSHSDCPWRGAAEPVGVQALRWGGWGAPHCSAQPRTAGKR